MESRIVVKREDGRAAFKIEMEFKERQRQDELMERQRQDELKEKELELKRIAAERETKSTRKVQQ